MKLQELNTPQFFIFTLLSCAFTFFVSIYIFCPKIEEYRITLATDNAHYPNFVDQLKKEQFKYKNDRFQIEPYYNSIADSMAACNVRMFELIYYSTNNDHYKTSLNIYFDKNGLKLPELVYTRFVDARRNIQRAFGIALLTFILCYLYLFYSKRRQKE